MLPKTVCSRLCIQSLAKINTVQNFLRQTKGTQLAEANPGDTHWGTGTSLRNKDSFNPDKWRGKNIAGMVLSRVRQTLG